MGLLDLIGANSQPMEEIEMPSFLLNRVRLGTIASNEDYYIANGNSIICKFCSVEMRRSETSYTCLKCGFFTVINGVNSEASFNTMKDNYTTSANSSTVLQIAGPHAARYQNNLRKNNSNYKTKQKNDTSSQMTAFINLSVTKIPPNIMREAINYFHAVQQHCITRSFNRIATMADCTYRICQKYGIVFKPKEIISIYGVEQKDLSKGSNNLDKLHSKGYLQEFSHHKNDYKIDFLNR